VSDPSVIIASLAQIIYH